MSTHLDELFHQYCKMLRDGLSPTGLVMEYEVLRKIGEPARAHDPRIEWGRHGPERLFGFKPQFVLSAPARFTFPQRLAATRSTGRDFTLRELRAL